MQAAPAIELKGVTKTFGHVVANKNVNLEVRRGEILAILGENGSGKTTLMNMISGIYFPDEGQIFIDGQEVTIRSPKDAFNCGIGMIHQHFKLVDLFTAAENIILGVNDGKKYNVKEAAVRVQEIADRYGFILDPNKKIYDMSVSEKQTVEIIKVLYRGADILILDEPTAVLTPQETGRLFSVLRNMRDDGKSIIIITHKLHEVLSLSDRVSVLRKGEYIGTVNTAETNENELTEMMVGKKITLNIDRPEPKNMKNRLVINDITSVDAFGPTVLDHVSFIARSGEILGIAGIAGSGQRELLEAIAGLQQLRSGEIVYYDPKIDIAVDAEKASEEELQTLVAEDNLILRDPETRVRADLRGKTKAELERMQAGGAAFVRHPRVNLRDKTPTEIREMGVRLSFVPEDRLGMGLVGNMDIIDNMMLRSYKKGMSVFVDRKNPRNLAEEIISELEVVTPGPTTPVRRLSGGNVQKVLVGREIAANPKVLMAAYPVRGLDINSSYTIYNLLTQQKESGVAVIFVGEDLDVLVELCDRILVINSGRVTGLLDGRSATKEEIGLLMTKTDDRQEGEADGSAE